MIGSKGIEMIYNLGMTCTFLRTTYWHPKNKWKGKWKGNIHHVTLLQFEGEENEDYSMLVMNVRMPIYFEGLFAKKDGDKTWIETRPKEDVCDALQTFHEEAFTRAWLAGLKVINPSGNSFKPHLTFALLEGNEEELYLPSFETSGRFVQNLGTSGPNFEFHILDKENFKDSDLEQQIG